MTDQRTLAAKIRHRVGFAICFAGSGMLVIGIANLALILIDAGLVLGFGGILMTYPLRGDEVE